MDWKELEKALIDINNKELVVGLSRIKYDSETFDKINRLARLCKQVTVDELRLSEGICSGVEMSSNKIRMNHVELQSGDDVTRLHHLVSQYQSWEVYDTLDLTELGSDDWALLAQLLPRLISVERVEIKSNSTENLEEHTLKLLSQKSLNLTFNEHFISQEDIELKYQDGDEENFLEEMTPNMQLQDNHDLLEMIFRYLDPGSVMTASLVSR